MTEQQKRELFFALPLTVSESGYETVATLGSGTSVSASEAGMEMHCPTLAITDDESEEKTDTGSVEIRSFAGFAPGSSVVPVTLYDIDEVSGSQGAAAKGRAAAGKGVSNSSGIFFSNGRWISDYRSVCDVQNFNGHTTTGNF